MGCGLSKSATKNIIPTSLKEPYLPPGQYCSHCAMSHAGPGCSVKRGPKRKRRRSKVSLELRNSTKHLLKKKSTILEEEGSSIRPRLLNSKPPSMIDPEEEECVRGQIMEVKEERGHQIHNYTLPDFNESEEEMGIEEKKFVSSDEELEEKLNMEGYMSPIYKIPGKYNPENFDDIVKRQGVKEILEIDNFPGNRGRGLSFREDHRGSGNELKLKLKSMQIDEGH